MRYRMERAMLLFPATLNFYRNNRSRVAINSGIARAIHRGRHLISPQQTRLSAIIGRTKIQKELGTTSLASRTMPGNELLVNGTVPARSGASLCLLDSWRPSSSSFSSQTQPAPRTYLFRVRHVCPEFTQYVRYPTECSAIANRLPNQVDN